MKKIKVEWLAAMLVVLVMGVVLLFLLISTLHAGSHEPDIQLPNSSEVNDESNSQIRPKEPGDHAQRVHITKRNVQDVVETLERPETYYCRVENVISYQDESRVTSTEQWVLSDQCITKTIDSSLESALCMITQDGSVTIWYEGDDRVLDTGAMAFTDIDLLAGVPTYEDVLELDVERITAADYRNWEGQACVYVETYDPEMSYTMRYYVSVENGLLVHAETYTQGELVYSMNMEAYGEDTSGSEGIRPPM